MNNNDDLGVSAITPPRFPLQSSAEDGERISTPIADAKERPILFSAPMVRAILDGSKTQTRRVVKPQPDVYFNGNVMAETFEWKDRVNTLLGSGPLTLSKHCPYGKPGDRLWVRETFADVGWPPTGPQFVYRADPDSSDNDVQRWKPSIFMPRWASRITLEVVSVRVERLCELSDEDAKAEGIMRFQDLSPSEVFEDLWESINGPGSWDANPWVWVVEFRKLPQP